MRANVDEQCIIHANSQFWEQMLDLSLEPFTDELGVGAGHVVGTINLSGRWKGRIEVCMAEGLVYLATASMLMMPVESVAEADVLDAAKEIANIIAGIIKSSLPRPCTMAVPESTVGRERFCRSRETEGSLAVSFQHAAGNLIVRVWEQECLPQSCEPAS